VVVVVGLVVVATGSTTVDDQLRMAVGLSIATKQAGVAEVIDALSPPDEVHRCTARGCVRRRWSRGAMISAPKDASQQQQ
jgi:hypothetical protein